MKNLLISLMLGVALLGCSTPQQTTTYNTLFSLEQTATAAYNAYMATVIAGTTSTNAVPQIAHAYNDTQAAITLAAALNANNANALATTNLVVEVNDLLNLINTAKGH